ncbi:ankyrin repeat-containing domain protein [Aspergillus pseudonomiae]|nr:ankyrin repeat-containing domain protein [Aspergillus pseudonomiae]
MEIARYLIDNGADPNFIGGIYGSALNVAAMRKGPELIRFLTRQGADIRMPDTNGRTPIHFAAYHGIDNLTIPLELGAVNLGDIDGWTPICYAARYTDNDDTPSVAGESSDILGVIHLLIRSGASLSVQALSGDEAWSPLRIACYSGATMDVIKSLKLPSEQRVADDEVNIGGRGDGRWCSECFWRESIFAVQNAQALIFVTGAIQDEMWYLQLMSAMNSKNSNMTLPQSLNQGHYSNN